MSKKPRNPVAEEAAYLTKPARHRDRKHDYQRRERHRESRWVDEEMDAGGKGRRRKESIREDPYWLRDSEGELASSYWLEPEEEPPAAG